MHSNATVSSLMNSRLTLALEWLDRSIADVFEAPFENPFEIEFRLNVLEDLLSSAILGQTWHNLPIECNLTYSRWTSGKLRDWTPVAFSASNPWEILGNERQLFVLAIKKNVSAALASYNVARSPKSLFAEPSEEGLIEFFSSRVRSMSKMGRLNSLFGGLLSVESQVRIAEDGLQCVFPEIHSDLNLHYPESDLVFRLYCQGSSEMDAAEQFSNAWNVYVANTNLSQ